MAAGAAALGDIPPSTVSHSLDPTADAVPPLSMPRVAAVSGGISPDAAGTIKVENNSLYVAAGDKWLEIKELQLAGKKRMAADAFLRGFREIESYKFV